jgi:hypothetical protein
MSAWTQIRADWFDAEKPTTWWGDAAWMVATTWALSTVTFLVLTEDSALLVLGLLLMVIGGVALSHAHGVVRRHHWARVADREPPLPRRSIAGIAIGIPVVWLSAAVLFWNNEPVHVIAFYAVVALVPTVGWVHGRWTVRRQTSADADSPT